MKIKVIAASFLFIICLAGPGKGEGPQTEFGPVVQESLAERGKFWRTELYFGMDKPDGSEVTEREWEQFLADEVTPRFPAGFTVIEALGQFEGADKKIVKEKSRLLILLYEKKDRKVNNVKIEEIRAAYKKAFQQESVMRLEMRQTVDVSF